MPGWSNAVPANPRGPAYPLLRTPPAKPLVAIVTSKDLVGCYTHFYKGRTIPCEGENCPAHQEGIPYRWHAYMSAYRVEDGVHFIFECTAQAAEHFTDYRDSNNGLRGCFFRASRMNSRANSRVIIRTKPCDLKTQYLPEPPNIEQCLSIIWDLPMKEP